MTRYIARRMVAMALAGCVLIAALFAGCADTVSVAELLDDNTADAPPPSPLVPSADTGTDGKTCADLGCNKVDLLFVIDSSPSMGSAQRRLKQAFPTFFN